jgi:hypothetical protein
MRLRWAGHVAKAREDKLYIQITGGESSYKLVIRETEESMITFMMVYSRCVMATGGVGTWLRTVAGYRIVVPNLYILI